MIDVTVVHHALRSGGGSERVIYDLLRGLDRERFRPSLICLYDLGEWGEELRSRGVPTHWDLMSNPYDLRGVFTTARLLERIQTDVLYVSDGFLNMIVGRAAASLANTPVSVLGFHSYDTVIRRRSSSFRRAQLSLADAIYHPRFSAYIALARSHKKYLVECKGLPAAKISVVYNGVHLTEFQSDASPVEQRRAFGVPTGARTVAMIAGFRKWKSHDILLASAARIVSRMADVHFLLAGDGPERPSLERLASTLGVAGNIHFLGKVRDIAGLLRATDVVALSSEHEAFPLSLLEAMAAGVPIVATDTGSVAEMIDDGVNGYIVEVGSIDDLTDSITRLLEDPARRREMGRAGRRMAEERFDIETTIDAYETVFELLVNAAS